MNARFAAYAIAAVLIGFAIMMLPLALETEHESQPNFTGIYPDSKNTSEQRDQLDNAYGLASQPSNITSSSLILLLGLIIALAAYILVKKQVNPPPAFSNWYKPF